MDPLLVRTIRRSVRGHALAGKTLAESTATMISMVVPLGAEEEDAVRELVRAVFAEVSMSTRETAPRGEH